MEIASRCGAARRRRKSDLDRSRRDEAASDAKKAAKKNRAPSDDMPPFVAPQLCTSVDRPPAGADWVHEIKFDGYRIQMRVEDGSVTLKTRKGLDWTAKFGAIATAAAALPNCIIDGEIVALDHRGSPDFAGLQAALSEGKTDDLIFFAFDLLFLEWTRICASECLVDRKRELKQLTRKGLRKGSGRNPLCRAFRNRGRCGPQICLPHVSGGHRLEAGGRSVRVRTHRYLDQGQMPRWARGGHRWLEQQRKPVQVADGRRVSRRSSGLCRQCRNGLRRRQGGAPDAEAQGCRVRDESVRRQGCAPQEGRNALVEAGARGGDRVCGFHRLRHDPTGRVQGTAPGQACQGSRSRGTRTIRSGRDRRACSKTAQKARRNVIDRFLRRNRDGSCSQPSGQDSVARRRAKARSPNSISQCISRASAAG